MHTELNQSPVSIQTAGQRLFNLSLRGFLGLTLLYGLGATGMVLLAGIVGERFWLSNLFITLLPGSLIFSVIVVPVLLLLRRTWLLLLNLPGLIVLVIGYGGAFIPDVRADASPDFTVLTYNIKHPHKYLDELAAYLIDSDADIIALQEFTPRTGLYLTPMLTATYPYSTTHNSACYRGLAIYSQYPIVDGCSSPERSHRHQRVVIDMQNRLLSVYSVHMPPPEWTSAGFDTTGRRPALDVLLQAAAKDPHPVVIMGDFNMGDMTADYQHIASRYTDAFRASGQGTGVTYPYLTRQYPPSPLLAYPLPVVRLDYIFHDDALYSLTSEVLPPWRSDHLPVRVDLAWADDSV